MVSTTTVVAFFERWETNYGVPVSTPVTHVVGVKGILMYRRVEAAAVILFKSACPFSFGFWYYSHKFLRSCNE